MTKRDEHLELPGELSGESPWFGAALNQGMASDAFRERCEEAALAGLAMVKLRKERERIGFLPLPFDRYVERLAGAASVALNGLCVYYGFPGLDIRAGLGAAARFAFDLGLKDRESKVQLRYCVVEEAGILPSSDPVLARGGVPRRKHQLADCERELEDAARQLPANWKASFDEIERLVEEVYGR